MRLFHAEDLLSYHTSLGKNPSDLGIYLPETPTTQLTFRIEIAEPANCSEDPKYIALRSTRLEIVRQPLHRNSLVFQQFENEEEVLVHQELLGYSPICSKDLKEVSLSFEQIQFKCKYVGTSGPSK